MCILEKLIVGLGVVTAIGIATASVLMAMLAYG